MLTDDHRPWRSLTRLAVRAYPRAWRARYEAEFLALLEDTPAGPARFVDVVRAGGHEWARAARAFIFGEFRTRALRRGRRIPWEIVRIFASAVSLSVFSVVFMKDQGPTMDALSVGRLTQFAFFFLRAFIVTELSMSVLAIAFRRSGRALTSGWFSSATKFFLAVLTLFADQAIARRLHAWASVKDLAQAYGGLGAVYLWMATWRVLAGPPTPVVGPRSWFARVRAAHREMLAMGRGPGEYNP